MNVSSYLEQEGDHVVSLGEGRLGEGLLAVGHLQANENRITIKDMPHWVS